MADEIRFVLCLYLQQRSVHRLKVKLEVYLDVAVFAHRGKASRPLLCDSNLINTSDNTYKDPTLFCQQQPGCTW